MFKTLSLPLLALLLAANTSQAATRNTQTLERWLQTAVVPNLANTLSRHPKFKGEVIRMSAMHDGHLSQHSNALVQAIERDLTHHLNRYENIRIRWRGQPSKPSDRPAHYVLGIEVRAHGSTQHRVTLAMVDLSEGIWVSGTAAQWQGRLSRSERLQLAQATAHAPTNSATLAPLTYQTVARDGVCKDQRDARCVEVQVKLNTDAQLVVFTTAGGKLRTACSAPLQRAAGTYRFRLAVTDKHEQRADMGLYAVTTHDKDLAQSLQRLVRQASGGCGQPADEDWQPALQHFLAARAPSFDWQALHFKRNRRGVSAL